MSPLRVRFKNAYRGIASTFQSSESGVASLAVNEPS